MTPCFDEDTSNLQEINWKNWKEGEPNGLEAEDDCAVYNIKNFKFYDVPCSWRQYPICSSKVSSKVSLHCIGVCWGKKLLLLLTRG